MSIKTTENISKARKRKRKKYPAQQLQIIPNDGLVIG